MYKIGAKVVYPMHGAGEIVEVIKQTISGITNDYYVFRMPIGNMKVMLPVDKVDLIGIREIISNKKLNQLLDSIDEMECIENANWNKRYRENMELLKTGCSKDVASVIKALTLRDRDKGLSTGERKMLSTARQILCSEIMLIKKVTAEEAAQLISEHIL